MMTANLNIIYYVPVNENGGPMEPYPRCALYDASSDAWVDKDTGIVIEFLGLVLGVNAVYSSADQLDVELWIKNSNS